MRKIFFFTEIQKRTLPPRPPAPKHMASSPNIEAKQQQQQQKIAGEDTMQSNNVSNLGFMYFFLFIIVFFIRSLIALF